MFRIRNKKDLSIAYSIIRAVNDNRNKGVIELKKNVRKYTHREKFWDDMVADFGIDGALYRCKAPEWVHSYQACVDWFYDNKYIDFTPKAYDCSGESYTAFFAPMKTSAGWIVYHRVSFDV